jgi:hypothetical protein
MGWARLMCRHLSDHRSLMGRSRMWRIFRKWWTKGVAVGLSKVRSRFGMAEANLQSLRPWTTILRTLPPSLLATPSASQNLDGRPLQVIFHYIR